MNVNDLKDGFGRDQYLWNDSLYFYEDNPSILTDEEYIDERELEERKNRF